MFGVLKKLYSWLTATEPPQPVEPATAATPTIAPAPAAPGSSAPPATEPATAQAGDTISLPLDEILSRMPATMAPLILSRPGGTFSFPVNIVWEQLRTGAVRIPFGQLRRGAPTGTFSDDATNDDSLIDLPLSLILTAIGPSALRRRPSQKQIEVPSEVMGVFTGKFGSTVRIASAAPVPPAAIPSPPPPPAAHAAPSTPAAPARPTTSITSSPTAPKAPASAPLPFATGQTSPRLAPSAPAPQPAEEPFVIMLGALAGSWPEAIRREINVAGLAEARIAIPMARLEPAMKAGRVVFTWAEVCGWLEGPKAPVSVHGGTQLELPLMVIAPLFMAKRRPAAPRKTLDVEEAIPDLFSQTDRPSAPAPAPTAPPAARPEPETLGAIFGQPSKRDWAPAEIARQIIGLPGVAGAVIATSDGLLVAGQAAAPVKAETMAAFLPQIFARTGAYAEEAQLGRLRALRLAAGHGPCAIYKAGTLYLAVQGKPDQALPEEALEQIARHLAKQNH
jgi:predicted regulator of Ras-like GTPase activity (Roadblock/LC7/MglB family)